MKTAFTTSSSTSKNMHLLMVFMFVAAVHATSRIYQPGLKAVNYAKAIEERKLNGNVLKEVKVDSEVSCQFECVAEEKCLSYNFGPTNTNDKRFNCQISDSDRFVGLANFTRDEKFKYRGIKSACEKDSSLCGSNEVCLPNYQDNIMQCKCKDSYTGKPCEPKSCTQLFKDGFKSSGVYTINPDGGKPMQVLCDMSTDGGGWSVFQRRLNGSVVFYLNWTSYKRGFGDLNGEFWLGNDNIHRLTSSGDFMLRVDLEDFEGNITFAEYTTFKLAGEEDKYRLSIGGFNGSVGDSMTQNSQSTNGMRFTTKDDDNDLNTAGNCAVVFKGAWWYRNCHSSNLNGQYLRGPHASYADGVTWVRFKGEYYSLKRTEMKLRAKV